MNTHTPGPWQTGKLGQNVQDAVGRLVASTVFFQYNDSKGDFANARLIAAAPTMYDALNAILNTTDYATIQAKAREAIAKATNGTA